MNATPRFCSCDLKQFLDPHCHYILSLPLVKGIQKLYIYVYMWTKIVLTLFAEYIILAKGVQPSMNLAPALLFS